MSNIAIFASGSGTNAEAIMGHFSEGTGKGKGIKTVLLLSNNPDAYALERARKFGVPAEVFARDEFRNPEGKVARLLEENQVDFIVLAGFLWLVPPYLIEKYRNRIVNIHPALLPKYGGKGMYGHHVHEAVIASGERESGITIHWVTEEYDSGDIIFQAKVPVDPGTDTPDSVAAKVHELEYRYFPEVIEKTLLG